MKHKAMHLIILLVIIAILGGCAASPRAIEGAEREAVLAYAEPMTDNELNALNENDYDAFVRDYNEAMLKATTPENFANLVSIISSKLGKYLSREVTAVTAVGEDAVLVIYTAKFENEEGVTIRLVFQPSGDHLITGLWFDSPKLREK
jgi:hypothetical protein